MIDGGNIKKFAIYSVAFSSVVAVVLYFTFAWGLGAIVEDIKPATFTKYAFLLIGFIGWFILYFGLCFALGFFWVKLEKVLPEIKIRKGRDV